MLRIARPSQARASQRSLLSFVTATCLLSASVIPAVAAPTAQATHATQASAAAQTSNTTQTAPVAYNRFIITYTDEAKKPPPPTPPQIRLTGPQPPVPSRQPGATPSTRASAPRCRALTSY